MAKIVIEVESKTGRVLKKKTMQIRGKLRLWLLAAHRTLQVIAAAREETNGHAARAKITLEGIARDAAFEMYSAWVKRYSPIPVEIYLVEKKPA